LTSEEGKVDGSGIYCEQGEEVSRDLTVCGRNFNNEYEMAALE
jgi:hypothetical protein